MTAHDLFDALAGELRPRGADILGAADLTPLPADVREGLPVGVCVGVALAAEVVAQIGDGPTLPYSAEFKRINQLLNELSARGAALLQAHGHRAVAGTATTAGRIGPDLCTPLPHKTVATRAGVGWIGKTALLITEAYGSAVRYNTILTDAPLPLGAPLETSLCGDCDACVRACPARAATGEPWRAGLPREAFYDAPACRAMAREQAARMGIDHPLCGICIAVCPHTRRRLAPRAGTQESPPCP